MSNIVLIILILIIIFLILKIISINMALKDISKQLKRKKTDTNSLITVCV